MKNYYDILGVSRTASEESIRKKYHELARKYHPDVYKKPDAEQIFKDINEAYAVLSDSLKRADYDQQLEQGFMRKKPEEAPREEEARAQPTLSMFLAAFLRMFFVMAVGILVGAFLEFFLWVLSKKSGLNISSFYLPMFWGGVLGALLGADLNFNVESFLGPSYMGRTYTFLRTFLFALSFAFFGGKIFSFLLVFSKGSNFISLFGITLGLILGSTFGSDGEGFFKLKSKEGRFNLLYTGLRAVEVGLIGAFMGAIFGWTLQSLAKVSLIFWSAFFGFSLGTIIGAISPPNLAAYASYASAAVKNIIIILMVAGAVILGILFGYFFHGQIQEFLKVFIK